MDQTRYQGAPNVRREFRSRTGRFRSAVLAPVMAVAVRENEGGMLQQSITMELDPIAGRMITPMYAEFYSVFVPLQAMDALKDPAAQYAGMTEVLRQKLLTGAPLFGTEPENEISRRCKVNPRSLNGVKVVSEAVRLAHNCAVNFLRTRRYDRAAKVLAANQTITPAIVHQTVLDLLNGVLDPDDRINGAVPMQFPVNVTLPVEGIGFMGTLSSPPTTGQAVRGFDASADFVTDALDARTSSSSDNATNSVVIRGTGTTGATLRPDVFARLNTVFQGNVSLDDLHNAETADRLVREMRAIVEENPEYGEDMVLRWAHGLKVEDARMPWLISEQRQEISRDIVPATDAAGVSNDTMRTDSMGTLSFSSPIPRTELGGIIVTFAVLKPDECIRSQPHPYLSDTWSAQNFVADEMMLDPVPVQARMLDSDVLQAQEHWILFYTGYNSLKRSYVDYGLSRQLNASTIANKTAVWQFALPLGVTPSNILYPANFSQFPFLDQNAEVVTYTVTSNARIVTPTQFGPTPVEEMPVISSATLLTN